MSYFWKVEGGNVCANTDEVADTLNALVLGGWPAPGSVTGCVPGEKIVNNELYGLYI
jgi:hypothetical protein